MPYTIRFTPRARRDFSALETVLQQRLSQHIDRLAENPFPAGAKRLHTEEPYYRIRVGDYRIVYQVDSQQLIVIVIKIGHRKDVYRHLGA